MAELVSSELDRVRKNTAPEINNRIDRAIAHNIHLYAGAPKQSIENRIRELDKEWDLERILELNASTISLIGIILGAFIDRWWLLLPALVAAFLCQHAVQGWCPPVPIFRRIGKRTRKEIDVEKFALKALRGDFDQLNSRVCWVCLVVVVIGAVLCESRGESLPRDAVSPLTQSR